jgi:hypothetical protein
VDSLTGNLASSFELCGWPCGLAAFFWCCHFLKRVI